CGPHAVVAAARDVVAVRRAADEQERAGRLGGEGGELPALIFATRRVAARAGRRARADHGAAVEPHDRDLDRAHHALVTLVGDLADPAAVPGDGDRAIGEDRERGRL